MAERSSLVFVCGLCGSKSVHVTAWVDPNDCIEDRDPDGSLGWYPREVGIDPPFDYGWCNNCERSVSVVEGPESSP